MTEKTVIVYSMQKAGSTTIMRALEGAGYEAHRGYAENIHTLPWRECPIVVPFRDPIEHAISWMFEKSLMEKKTFGGIEMQLYDFPALFWFDNYFEPLFAYNPMDDSVWGGTELRIVDLNHRDSSSSLLLIRTDKLSGGLALGLHGLLHRDEEVFKVQHRARGVERFREYEEYQYILNIPEPLLTAIVGSDYVKAFWNEEEQEAMRERWSEK